ncbi:MAG TPA: glutamate racemase [Candidatus Saccharimonadales bacterium]|nr:glutamate racemase [Candidatus Saccharimonadales bacterium]
MRIGVFDSGIGGEAIAERLRELLPHAEIISVNDRAHMPYGNRTPAEIIELTNSAIQPLLELPCDAIVIACNTATTVAIAELRSLHPQTHFIGIEPMIKPASSLTKTGHIAVCATPRTLQSARYDELKRTWAADIEVIEPDCSQWAELIEYGKSDQIDIAAIMAPLVAKGVDVIVLGCTHYHWVKQRILDTVGDNITVLEPSDAIAERIKSLLNQVH